MTDRFQSLRGGPDSSDEAELRRLADDEPLDQRSAAARTTGEGTDPIQPGEGCAHSVSSPEALCQEPCGCEESVYLKARITELERLLARVYM